MRKLHIGILFGGKSTEHDISIKSAENIFHFMNKKFFDISMIFINKNGHWLLTKLLNFSIKKEIISIHPHNEFPLVVRNNPLKIDVIFPVIHGKYGEDGSIQGLLRMINLPFVGSDILSSSISMDKDFTKRLLHKENIPTNPFICLNKHSYNTICFNDIKNKIKFPVFVKPSNQGSSIGINLARNEKEFYKAIKIAFDLDNKIIIEKKIYGKEIECGILGNNNPQSSVCGEILTPHNSFYDYNYKYINTNYAKTIIPANITNIMSNNIRNIAIKAFKILNCKGMARVDFFITKKNKIILNEINTIPGFTNFSMYPKLWMATKINHSELLTKLIYLSIDYYNQKKILKSL